MLCNIRYHLILLLIGGACSSPSNTSYDSTQQIIAQQPESLISEIIPGKVFAGEGTTAKGEPIYFGIELIEKGKNLEPWLLYISESRLGSYKRKKEGKFNALACYFPFELPEKFCTGFSAQEKNIFVQNRQKKFSSRDKESTNNLRRAFAAGVGEAAPLESANNEDEYYIAYLSKDPIKGYFNHPKAQGDESILLADFHESYKNLLMIVRCVDIAGTSVYNNRGISRGLRSFLEGGYKGISVILHSFTADFFKHFKQKTHMSVSPMKNMYDILNREFGNQILRSSNISPQLNHFRGLGGDSDVGKCVLPCNALIEYLHTMKTT